MARGQLPSARFLLAVASLGGCGRSAAPPSGEAPVAAASAPAASADRLSPLHALEEARRATTDFARLPASSGTLGPDPIALRTLPGTSRFVGLLRGRDALVLLDLVDGALRELARVPAPASPTGLAVTDDGEVLVSGELASRIDRFRMDGDALRPSGSLEVRGALAIRDLAVGPEGVVYVVEEHDGRLLTLPLKPASAASRPAGAPPEQAFVGDGAFRVARAGRFVIVDCLLDHALVVRPVDAGGIPQAEGELRLRHDGPLWGFTALATGDGLLLASGGVEDHPLDRTEGSFGFIDSFVFLDRVRGGRLEHLGEVNVSALGVITPKALLLHADPRGALDATVTGYGSATLVELAWSGDLREAPTSAAFPFVPGAAAIAPSVAGPTGNRDFVFADPLLDAWGTDREGKVTVTAVPEPAGLTVPGRSLDSRVGEALFFTSLMAPWNRSDGRLSRFTCETCHFEGYADGRTHHTGRADVHATTKPLLGLFNNRPHFSRALDPDLTTVADNEFRVAGAKSDRDPWFRLAAVDFPWLAHLGVGPGAVLSPEDLRRSLMAFLMDFTHRPNPATAGRRAFTPLERTGAEVFRDRCERCHAARLGSDVPASRVPFEAWEARVMSPEGPIVWGRDGYERTGVQPYVHEQGARPPSLRRLYKKRPYFTNGSAKDLERVLDTVRFGAAQAGLVFFHDATHGAAPGGRLSPEERAALLAFLDLL